MRFEVLLGFPAHGSMPLSFSAGEWTGAWSGHSEGLVVRFSRSTGEAWVGNFQPGSIGWDGVLEHPNGKHLIVFARGQGYVVDPEKGKLISRLSHNIQHVVPLPELSAIVISDGLGFEAINKDGVWWQSPRISWDEIRNIEVKGAILRAEASMPETNGNRWFPFTVDLLTGACDDGIYNDTIHRAIPVKPRRR